MKPFVLSFLVASVALGAAAAQDETIAILELHSRANPISAAEASDHLREAVRRSAPDARIVDRTGELVQRASATAGTRRELMEAIEAATGDLLRARPEALAAGPLTIAPVQLPDVPTLAEPAEDSVLNLDADANVLVAWDRARRVEARGKEHPDDAAYAWRRLASMPGPNPFREIALSRAQQWDAYASARRAAEAQQARDAARLRKVLPLASVAEATKIDLLVRFANAYGFDKVSPLVALLPSADARVRAELSLDCEVKEAHACVQLARAADDAKDAKTAVEFLDRACAAGAPEACAEAGDRWLQPDTLDAVRATAALQRGCDAGNGPACVRLARLYEEGEGAAPNPKLAADAREKACTAGDGKSCRRLAGMTDEAGRIADLLRKGCDGGDSLSCALAAREPALVQRQLQEASAAAKKASAPAATPAATTVPATKPPPPPPPPRTEESGSSNGKAAAGMIVFGALAGAGALMLALDDGDTTKVTFRSGPGPRNLVYQAPSSSPPGRTVLTVLMGTAAVISTTAGLAALFSKPKEPEKPGVGFGVAPTGVVVSGKFQ